MTRAQFVVLIGSKSYYQCRSYEELHVSGDLPLPTERGQAPEVFCWSGFGRGCVKLNKFHTPAIALPLILKVVRGNGQADQGTL